MKPLNSGNASGRFDAHQGNESCGFAGGESENLVNGVLIEEELQMRLLGVHGKY